MSIRRGYFYVTKDDYGGPFDTIREAKEAASQHAQHTSKVSIVATVTLETRDHYGSWETVH